jgi:hypothetical protein
MAASNKTARAGALGNVTAALGVARAGTPHQGGLNGDIPANVAPLESPYSDNSVAANDSVKRNSYSISNSRTIIQKWKDS